MRKFIFLLTSFLFLSMATYSQNLIMDKGGLNEQGGEDVNPTKVNVLWAKGDNSKLTVENYETCADFYDDFGNGYVSSDGYVVDYCEECTGGVQVRWKKKYHVADVRDNKPND